jgi:hypothetical protein
MTSDGDRIKQALARRAERVKAAEAARAGAAAEQNEKRERAMELARRFSTVVGEAVRATVDSLNIHGSDLPKAGYSIVMVGNSVSRDSTQAPSFRYALKSSAGVASSDMLMFKHVGDSVRIELGANPHPPGGRRATTGLFRSRAVAIADFRPIDAASAFTDFIEVALPTFPA